MISYYVKNLLVGLFGIALAYAIVFVLLLPTETWFIDNYALVSPAGQTDLDLWLKTTFAGWATYCTLVPFALASIWLIFTLFDSGVRGSWFWAWVFMWLAAVGVTGIYARLAMLQLLAGAVYPSVSLAFNNFIFFWTATIWWTPATHRCDPVGSIGRSWFRHYVPFL